MYVKSKQQIRKGHNEISGLPEIVGRESRSYQKPGKNSQRVLEAELLYARYDEFGQGVKPDLKENICEAYFEEHANWRGEKELRKDC